MEREAIRQYLHSGSLQIPILCRLAVAVSSKLRVTHTASRGFSATAVIEIVFCAKRMNGAYQIN